MNCENCGKEHDGNYGSGRFCSAKCARGFSTKSKRKEINEKIRKSVNNYFVENGNSLQLKLETKQCKKCDSSFKQKRLNQTFCSVKCARQNNINKATISQRENPPNWSKINKQAYANGNNYVAGGTTKWYEVNTSNGAIRVQGTYEVRACKILDNWLSSGKIYKWEYTNDRYQYIGEDNKEHTYLLDFKVWNNEKEFYYIETKGFIRENDELKWQAIKELGYNIDIWFDKDLKKYEF